jgi:hypothetical protein
VIQLTEDYQYPESYDEDDKIHHDWWAEEMQRMSEILRETAEEVGSYLPVKLAGTHTSLKKSGQHRIKIEFLVEGKSLEEFKTKSGEDPE